MSSKLNEKNSDIIFTDELEWYRQIPSLYYRFAVGLFGWTDLYSPYVSVRRLTPISMLKRQNIDRFFQLLRIEGTKIEVVQELVRRLKWYSFITGVFGIVLAFGLAISFNSLLTNMPNWIEGFQSDFSSNTSVGLNLLLLLIVILYGMTLVVAYRIPALMITRYFAESLCAVQGLNIMLELTHPNSLILKSNRKKLQNRVNSLAHTVLLMAHQYDSGSNANDEWTYKHFKEMELYIRERERWIIAPRETSLADLQRDFRGLLDILLSGNYGEFRYDAGELVTPRDIPIWQQVLKSVFSALGIVIPISVLYIVYIDPARIQTFGIESNTIVLLSMAWLFLALDSLFSFGLVEKVINLIKTFRELK